MPFGVETIEVITFFKQIGLAVSGAAALWGFVFYKKNCHQLARKMLIHFFVWFVVGIISWFLWTWLSAAVQAHEGIVIHSKFDHILRAQAIHLPFILSAVAVAIASFIWARIGHNSPDKLGIFYFLEFILLSFVIGLPAWTGSFSREQIFFIGHGWHSILTLGTVVTVDFLMLNLIKTEEMKKNAHQILPIMSKFIWLGLGIDFLSSGLIFKEGFNLTDKFFFMQTVVGIIIINGVLLSGQYTRKILSSINNLDKISKKWKTVFGISGAISLISWSTITLVDHFSGLTLSYVQLLSFYIFVIAIAFITDTIISQKNHGV